MTNKKLNVLKDENPKSLVKKIVELFQEGKEKGFTSTPFAVSKILESDFEETALTMLKLEAGEIRILYSAWNKGETYSINPQHLWKRTIPEVERLIEEYLM